MLIGAFDGLIQELNCILRFKFSQNKNLFYKCKEKLKDGYPSIFKKIDNNRIDNLNSERVDYAHKVIKGEFIIKDANDPFWVKPKIYDRRDIPKDVFDFKNTNKEKFKKELKRIDDWITKLRKYYNLVYELIDDVYCLLIPEIKKLYQC